MEPEKEPDMDTTEYQNWMEHGPWKVRSTDGTIGNLGVAAMDTLRFTPAMTIEIMKSNQMNFSVWGKQCEIKDDGLHGITDLDGRPFLVQRDPATGQLDCTFMAVPIPQQATSPNVGPKGPIRASTLNARSQPVTSTRSRQATSSSSAVVTPPSGDPLHRNGSTATWVADPGSSGTIKHPGDSGHSQHATG
jgi:hypothetical protein